MDYEVLIKERYSCRKFSNKKVEDEKVQKILEAGNLAPTAKNFQPQRIYVIKSEEGLAKVDKVCPCRYNAQVVLLVCANMEEVFTKTGFDSSDMDISIVTTHMMLEATNLGVDNIWIELFDQEQIKAEFDIPENIKPICILDLGYKTEEAHPAHLHFERKDLSDIIEYK